MSEPAKEWVMRKYVLALLYKGPTPPSEPSERKALLKAHLANIERLHAEGKIILAGPIVETSADLEGVFLFNTESLAEARAWCDSDPAIGSGDLRADLFTWFSAEGIAIVQPGELLDRRTETAPPAATAETK